MSRRRAEELIAQGRVSVNDVPASLGMRADPEADRITVDGKPLPQQSSSVYLMLNKPRGYVTTLSDERGRKTAASLVDCGCRVYPIGRLDCASEGLLLFTNDGEFANRLMHPRGSVEKEYEVTVRGALDTAQTLLQRRVVLDGVPIREPKVRLLRMGEKKATFSVTICEGRNRQIRRMCELAGLEVARLRRVREGTLTLGALRPGAWRYLTAEEIDELRRETEA